MVGFPDSGNSTFSKRLPPVADYVDQHRTNIILDFSPIIDTNYYLLYGSALSLTNIDLATLKSATKTTAVSNAEALCRSMLVSIQQGSVLHTTGAYLGGSTYATEVVLISGEYWVKKIALYNVTCLNWVVTNLSAPTRGQRAFMVLPSTTNSVTGAFAASTIQWGFHPTNFAN